MSKPLPDVFAVHCVRDRWLAVAPAPGDRSQGRTFDRRELRVIDCDALATYRLASPKTSGIVMWAKRFAECLRRCSSKLR